MVETESYRPQASVQRAIAMLDALAGAPGGLGTNEAARRIGASPATASRLLATLAAGGLARRDEPDGPWRLGLHLVALADGVLASLDVREAARPHLRALAEATGESVTLSVPGGGEAVTVDFVPSPASVVSIARLGRPSVLHATATGKAMLAFGGAAPPAAPLERFTERTITSLPALADAVAAIRARGHAESVGEREEDLAAIAAPVRGRGGALAAIVGVQGPAGRFTAGARRDALPRLLACSDAIARAVGG